MPRDIEEEASWLQPKWLVAGVALSALAILTHVDTRLGIAAGALFGGALAMWFYLALRYGSLSGWRSVRAGLVERAMQQELNRRHAAQRDRADSGPEQGTDPAERP